MYSVFLVALLIMNFISSTNAVAIEKNRLNESTGSKYTEYGSEDDEDEDDDEDSVDCYDFSKVNKKYSRKQLSTDARFKIKYKNQAMGYTHIVPIEVEKQGTYEIGFTDETYGECSFCLVDESGKVLIEKYNYNFEFDDWHEKINLSEGYYSLKSSLLENLRNGQGKTGK